MTVRHDIAIALLAAGLTGAPTRGDVTQSSYWVNDSFFEYDITQMPDFDQKRDALPNDGSMYCVPTSTLNLMAYAANHGFPGLEPGSNPAWQSQVNYAEVTGHLMDMGALMDTSATNGTGGSEWLEGANDWLLLAGFAGQLTITHYYADDQFAPTPSQMAQVGLAGGIVAFGHGRWEIIGDYDGFPLVQRNGGHVVTLSRTAADGFETILAVRDPADGGDLDTQSMFGDRWFDPQTHTVAKCGAPECVGVSWSAGQSETVLRLIDGYVAIRPLQGLAFTPGTGVIRRVDPFTLQGSPPQSDTFTLPGAPPIDDARMDPDGINVVTLSEGTISLTHPLTGQTETVTTVPGAEVLEFGRGRELYTFADGQVICLRLENGTATTTATAFPPSWVDRMAYDDATDRLWMLSIDGHALMSYPGQLAGPVTVHALPPGIAVEGEAAVAAHPAGDRIFFGSPVEDAVHVMELPGGGPPAFSSIFAPDVYNVSGLCFDDRGHLLVTSSDQVVELEETAPGTWGQVLDSAFAGVDAGGGRFFVTRSRTNFDPKRHGGFAWRHLPPEEAVIEGAEFEPDCPADVAPSGTVDVNDLVEVIQQWGSCPAPCPVDITGDGQVGVDDLVEVIVTWGPCPP